MIYPAIVKLMIITQLFFTLSASQTEFSDPELLHRVETTQKIVAFTFDDGPDPLYTKQIVQQLTIHHAHATFFVIGRKVAQYPNIIKYEVEKGNEVGNHSFSHDLHWSSPNAFQEIKLTQEQVYRATGIYPKYFRPPMGIINPLIRQAAKQAHLRIVLWAWDQDTRDWNGRIASAITQHVLDHIHPGDIILFHDGASKQTNTVQALKVLLPALERKQYKVVTISELLQSSSK